MADKNIICTHCKKQVAIEKHVLDSIEEELWNRYAAALSVKKNLLLGYVKNLAASEKDLTKIWELLEKEIEAALSLEKEPVKKTVLNCWEFKKCGREPGGAKVKELGVCPAAVEQKAAGINRGTCGGRACWAIAGTFCGGKVQGTFAQKLASCLSCEFYKKVAEEEGRHYQSSKEILDKLHPPNYSI